MRKSLFTLLGTGILVMGAWNYSTQASISPEPVKHQVPTEPAKVLGSAAVAKPISTTRNTPHPFMAPPGISTMHSDGWNSDVNNFPTPLGINPEVVSRDTTSLPGGQCATMTFNSAGFPVTLCSSILGFNINLFEPTSLRLLATFDLPARPSTFESIVKRDKSIVMTDSSGGAYYYLDHKDRVVLADSKQRLLRLAHRKLDDGSWEFYIDDQWDLSPHVPQECMTPTNWFPNPEGECDPITSVMPDFDGYIWWTTRQGRVGTLNPETGEVRKIALGEEIQNGMSVDEKSLYIVSDHALYSMKRDADDKPSIVWREAYDLGSSHKVGSINQGSGTTPTLMGERYITITDNADEQINLLVFNRLPEAEGQRLLCQVPLFEPEHSATDNSMIAVNRSIVIENNSGYSNSIQQTDFSSVAGGVWRIDLREDESGCDVIWRSPEKAPSNVPKLSTETGLVFIYTFEEMTAEDGSPYNNWYLVAMDYETGETAYKILTGSGRQFDNNWAPITLAADGTLYVGITGGIVSIKDRVN